MDSCLVLSLTSGSPVQGPARAPQASPALLAARCSKLPAFQHGAEGGGEALVQCPQCECLRFLVLRGGCVFSKEKKVLSAHPQSQDASPPQPRRPSGSPLPQRTPWKQSTVKARVPARAACSQGRWRSQQVPTGWLQGQGVFTYKERLSLEGKETFAGSCDQAVNSHPSSEQGWSVCPETLTSRSPWCPLL